MKTRYHTALIASIALAVCLLSITLFTTGCISTTTGEKPTAQAAAFTSLKASAVAIDAYRAHVELSRDADMISATQWAEFAKAYNTANQAIIDAAKLLRDVGGMDAQSPESVNAAVATLLDVVVKLVPPKR